MKRADPLALLRVSSAQIDIILNMYNNNFTIEQIALATQYDVDKIKEIIQKN